MTITSLSEAKAHLSDYVTSAETTHERTTITRNGKPAAVLLAWDDLNELLETLSVLSDPKALAGFAEAEITTRYDYGYTRADTHLDDDTPAPLDQWETRLATRMGKDAYLATRAAIRADLLAHPDANVRERAADYE